MTTTPHWPSYARRQVGLGDTISDARATINSGVTVDATTVMAAASLTPAQVSAMATTAYNNLSADAQAAWTQASSQSAGDARVVQGAADAMDLVSAGYNPDSDADNQKLIGVVAGAVTLIPGVGLVLGGAIAILDVVGIGIAKALEDVGLIWYGCRSSGNWTPGAILNEYPSIPMQPGSFGALAVPLLVANAASFMNCKGTAQHQVILAAAASMWNTYASGPPMSVYVPAMAPGNEPFVFAEQAPIAFAQANAVTDLPNGNWATAQDPYGNPLLAPFDTSHPTDVGSYAGTSPMGFNVTRAEPPFILKLNGSTFNGPSRSIQYHLLNRGGALSPTSGGATQIQLPKPGLSTGTKIAIGAALGAGALVGGSALYAHHAGVGVLDLWKGWGRAAKRVVTRR